MFRKSLICISVAFLAAFMVSGCGTSQKKVQSEVTGIKTRVETLESRVESVESKQAEAERTTAEQAQALDEMKTSGTSKVKTNISVKSKENTHAGRIKDVQQALKNAGYYSGSIDGVKGKSTKKAIKDFQKANGLKADGVVGRKTWEILSNHLSSPSTSAAPASASPEEGIK